MIDDVKNGLVKKEQAYQLRKIFEARKKEEPGLNNKVLAEYLDIDPSAVSRLLSGSLPISVPMALKLSRRLECHPALFHEEFANFSEYETFENRELIRRYALLPPEDQQTVEQVIHSLDRKKAN